VAVPISLHPAPLASGRCTVKEGLSEGVSSAGSHSPTLRRQPYISYLQKKHRPKRQKDFHDRLVYSRLPGSPSSLTLSRPPPSTFDLYDQQHNLLKIAVAQNRPKVHAPELHTALTRLAAEASNRNCTKQR